MVVILFKIKIMCFFNLPTMACATLLTSRMSKPEPDSKLTAARALGPYSATRAPKNLWTSARWHGSGNFGCGKPTARAPPSSLSMTAKWPLESIFMTSFCVWYESFVKHCYWGRASKNQWLKFVWMIKFKLWFTPMREMLGLLFRKA